MFSKTTIKNIYLVLVTLLTSVIKKKHMTAFDLCIKFLYKICVYIYIKNIDNKNNTILINMINKFKFK